MNAFARFDGLRALRRAYSIGFALVCASGCSGLGQPPAAPLGSASGVQSQAVTSADFKRIAVWGSKGVPAVAQCPQGYKVIAGGSSSSNGSFVGTGHAEPNLNSWVVKPDSGASAEAFATCVSLKRAGPSFRWVTGPSISGLAGAKCGPDRTLVTGYGVGAVTTSWFNQTTNTYWVSGGGTAYASCARNGAGVVIRHAWNKSQKPKTVYAGCGKGYTVIGGAMGDGAWPGPPIQQHPGASSGPGVHGYAGWWTFSNAQNELTWAACVQT